jgi:hypothetical protein
MQRRLTFHTHRRRAAATALGDVAAQRLLSEAVGPVGGRWVGRGTPSAAPEVPDTWPRRQGERLTAGPAARQVGDCRRGDATTSAPAMGAAQAHSVWFPSDSASPDESLASTSSRARISGICAQEFE